MKLLGIIIGDFGGCSPESVEHIGRLLAHEGNMSPDLAGVSAINSKSGIYLSWLSFNKPSVLTTYYPVLSASVLQRHQATSHSLYHLIPHQQVDNTVTTTATTTVAATAMPMDSITATKTEVQLAYQSMMETYYHEEEKCKKKHTKQTRAARRLFGIPSPEKQTKQKHKQQHKQQQNQYKEESSSQQRKKEKKDKTIEMMPQSALSQVEGVVGMTVFTEKQTTVLGDNNDSDDDEQEGGRRRGSLQGYYPVAGASGAAGGSVVLSQHRCGRGEGVYTAYFDIDNEEEEEEVEEVRMSGLFIDYDDEDADSIE